MSQVRTFTGICVGGDAHGEARACDQPVLRLPVYRKPDLNANTEIVDLTPVDHDEYWHRTMKRADGTLQQFWLHRSLIN